MHINIHIIRIKNWKKRWNGLLVYEEMSRLYYQTEEEFRWGLLNMWLLYKTEH